jgi:hypothetical protein
VADDGDIYEALAAAVADVREPDLSRFAPSAVRGALDRALRPAEARAKFLAWLNGRVQSLSGGRVSIEERPESDAVDPPSGPDAPPELPIRVVVRDEPFAESAVLRADDSALHYPMRG